MLPLVLALRFAEKRKLAMHARAGRRLLMREAASCDLLAAARSIGLTAAQPPIPSGALSTARPLRSSATRWTA